MNFSITQSITRTPSVLSSQIEDEVVMMSLEEGMYYNLNALGSSVWTMLETPHTLNQIVEKLMAEYEVDKTTCLTQTKAFLESLAERNLIAVS